MEKKFTKTIKNPKTGKTNTVRYGQKGSSIKPGTAKGDAYCARSAGQMRDHKSAANDPNSPLRLSRKKWACIGSRSARK